MLLNYGRCWCLHREKLEDHLSGIPRIWSRWLLRFLPGPGFHVQYMLIRQVTLLDLGNANYCTIKPISNTLSDVSCLCQDHVWADTLLPISFCLYPLPCISIFRNAHPSPNLLLQDLCKLDRKEKNRATSSPKSPVHWPWFLEGWVVDEKNSSTVLILISALAQYLRK